MAMMDSISSLLTDEIVQSAPTKKKSYTIRDGRGLFVLIHPNGSRYFQLRATIEGKRKLMQLGVYPQVTIEEARALAVARLQIEMGDMEPNQGEFFNMREDKNDAIVAAPLVDVPEDMLEQEAREAQQVKVTSFTEEEAIAMQRTENKTSAPRVSLQYSQLVYVPKTLPKTFSQKLAERAHPKVLGARLFAKLMLSASKLKEASLKWILEARAALVKNVQRLGSSINLTLSKCKTGLVFRLGGIKNKCSQLSSKLRLKLLSFKLPDFTWPRRKTQEVEIQGVELTPSEARLDAVELDAVPIPLETSKQDKPNPLALLTISLKKLPQQLQDLRRSVSCRLSGITAMPKQFIQNEAIADRADVVSVYGLFAESKGNYFIYTIKSITASVLAKKG